MESNCAGLILHRQKPPLTRRSLVYYCSDVHTRSAIVLASALKMPWLTYSYAMMDLKSLGLVDSSYDCEQGETVQWLTRQAKRLLREIGIRVRRGRLVKGDLVVWHGSSRKRLNAQSTKPTLYSWRGTRHASRYQPPPTV